MRACIKEASGPDRVEQLRARNESGASGSDTLHKANRMDDGSYDTPSADCCAVLHVGTAMAYGGANKPQQVYDGAVSGTQNVMSSKK